MIDYEEYKLSSRECFLIAVSCIISASLVGRLFFGAWILGVFGALEIKVAVKMYKLYKIRQRKRLILCEFKDCLYSFSSSFFSGRHMAEAILEAIIYLSQIYGENSLLMQELSNMSTSIETVKEDDCKLWIDFGTRTQIDDIKDFAEIYSCCRETGGDLTEVVNRASKIISDKIDTENEIESLLSQRKFEGRLIAMMPVVILLFLNVTAPEYIKVMYETLRGHILMALMLIIMIFGFYVIERIVSIEI